jgi:hypothetical protein
MAGDVARKPIDPVLNGDLNCRRIYARLATKFLFDVVTQPPRGFHFCCTDHTAGPF